MPIETPTGTLEVENAKFRASSVEATIAVGIGTDSNDAYPLQIFKETAPSIRLSEGSTLSSAARFYSNNSNLYIQTGTNFTSGSSGDVAFQNMGGQSTHMVIKSDGNVGVGTTDPTLALEVYSSTGTQLKLSSSSRYSTIYGVDDTGSCFFGNDGGAFRITTGGDTSGTGASEKFRVLSSGNVGIGLTTPTKMLHTKGEVVVGTSGDNYQNELGSLYFIRGATRGGTGFGDRHHYISTVTDGTAGGPAGNKMLFYIDDSTSINGTSHVNSLTLTGSGNVGIGTSEPRAPLDVMGIPYGPGARPIFSAYESDEYSVTSVGYITLGNTFVNGLNCYNTLTGIFTAPVDGIYCFIGNCTIRANTGSGNSTWSFYINNTNWNPTSTGRPITFQAIDTGTNHQQTSGALIWSLNKNDTVRIYATGVPTNTNQNWGQGYGRFLGFLLS